MKKIALISDGWKRLITYAWVDGIMTRIRELGEDISLYQYNCYGNWSKDQLNNIGEYNIYNLPELSEFDGIVLDCSNIVDEEQRTRTIKKLRDSGVPVVSIEYDVEGFYYVGADNMEPITELIRHLYDVHGCRRFVFAGGPPDAFANREREQAFRNCIAEFGLDPADNPILSGDYDYETGVRYMREMHEAKAELPDAFVCANDNIAAGLCAEAEELGYHVPEDFLVTGFDNLDKAVYFRPQITTVWQDRGKIGSMCVDLFLDLWKEKQIPKRSYVATRCLYAESCGCPNNGMVDYREYIKGTIVGNVLKDQDDARLMDLEADMAKCEDFETMFQCIIEYFKKLRCDGVYFVVDQKLFEADTHTVFPTEGYDWENLVVANGFDVHEERKITSVAELYQFIEDCGGGNAYIFTPIHFHQQAVGYLIMKNSRFLYDNPYYYDIHCAIVKALENLFKQQQLEKALQKLQDLYNRDSLTGVYNRIAYAEMIQPAFANYNCQGVVCAVVFVDADDFKTINDTYGHEFGDKVLKQIASVLNEECPENGYVCRYGGDEFLAFFPHATPARANSYQERVKARLKEAHISISMGIKLTHGSIDATLDEYLSMADQSMYEQKQAHKRARRE